MRNKKGISLIVLVITIIVMIILAASVVITLSNSGIINKANDAVNATNLKEVQNLAQLLWSEAYMEGNRTAADIQAYINGKLSSDIKAKYDVVASEVGVTVTAKTATNTPDQGETGGETPDPEEGETPSTPTTSTWKLTKTSTTDVSVSNGTVTIPVGTWINYTAPAGKGYTPETDTTGWRVLGVDEQNRLLIMSATGVPISSSSTSLSLSGQSGVTNAITLMKTACEGYADGVIGVASRPVNVNDINAVTGYKPSAGSKVTYTWTSGGTGGTSSSGGTFTTFNYPNVTAEKYASGELVTGDWTSLSASNLGPVEYTSDYYSYTGTTYLANTTEAYKMIFKKADGNTTADTYWLASRYVNAGASGVGFGVRRVDDGSVGGRDVYISRGNSTSPSNAVRAAVSLASDVQVTYTNGATSCTIVSGN